MVFCVASGCSNRSDCCTKRDGITFHRFPDKYKTFERSREWVNQIGRNNWEPSKFSRICSKHFEESCFDKTGRRTRLRNNAIPTIFDYPSHIQNNKPVFADTSPSNSNITSIAEANVPQQAMDFQSVYTNYATSRSATLNKKKNYLETIQETIKQEADLTMDDSSEGSHLLCNKYRSNAPSANKDTFSSNSNVTSTIVVANVPQQAMDFQSVYTNYATSVSSSLVNMEHSYSLSPLPKKIKNNNNYWLDKIHLNTKNKKSLLGKIRFLKSKVNRLEKEIKLCKMKKENAFFMDNYNNLRDGIAKEIIKNIVTSNKKTKNVKIKYAADILIFAKTLYFISQEAYEYVKTVLNDTLPEAKKAAFVNKKADLDPRFLKSISISNTELPKQNKDSNLSEYKNKEHSSQISIDISNFNQKPHIKSSKIKNIKKASCDSKSTNTNYQIKRKQVLLQCAQNSKRRAISKSNKDVQNTTHSAKTQFDITVPVILTENELQLTSNETVTNQKSNHEVITENGSNRILNTISENDSDWTTLEEINDHELNSANTVVCNENEFIPLNTEVSINHGSTVIYTTTPNTLNSSTTLNINKNQT